jgi:hypothetical protein
LKIASPSIDDAVGVDPLTRHLRCSAKHTTQNKSTLYDSLNAEP